MNVELGAWGWLYNRLKEFCTSELILTGVPCHNMHMLVIPDKR